MGHGVLLLVASLLAGAINAVAGGGTLLTFPTLVAVVNPVIANATSTVALIPGSFASSWGYRKEFRGLPAWYYTLIIPSFLGGIIGSLLVIRLDEKIFSWMVPWLILTAAFLFLLQPYAARWRRSHAHASLFSPFRFSCVLLFQFLVSVYGGYFGAGIGILMLSALGFMGLENIHQMNALKTLLALIINGVSLVVFVLDGKVAWHLAIPMAFAAVVGGYFGATFALALNPRYVRLLVVLTGFSLGLYFLVNQ